MSDVTPTGLPWASAGKMGKYAIRTIPIPALTGMRHTWLARMPYGTWQMFTSWEGAAAWLWSEHRAHIAAQGPVREADRASDRLDVERA